MTSAESRFAVLRDRDFRDFFAGNAISRIGDSPVPVAFAVATYQLSGSPRSIAVVLLSLWASRLLMVGPGGVIADRFNRVKVMVAADIIRLVAQGALAVVVFSSAPTHVWEFCVSAALYGVGSALYVPAQIGFTPRVVGAEDLKRANGLFSLVGDASFLLGPAMAGILMTWIGFGWVLVIDCVSFVLNMLLIARLSSLGEVSREARVEQDASEDHRFVAGLRITRDYPWFSVGLFLWFFVAMGIGLVSVAGPAIAVGSLGGIGAWSVLSTCLAAGSLVGSLSVIVYRKGLTWPRAAAIVAVGCAPQYVLLAFQGSSPHLWLVAAGFLVAALVTASCGVVWDAEYQHRLPERFLSRLGSVENFVNTAGVPVGMLLGGMLAGHYRALFLVLAVLVFVTGAPSAVLARRSTSGASPALETESHRA